ncbi:transmembrane protease serine 11D-like isoform X2 [Haliotis cracherodii]|uniref:transmembrane protease serine 11D-like isoform X2 n=1 Tax=Haliotis cracherodii TaxID=6455 RepID=UPI0039E7929E
MAETVLWTLRRLTLIVLWVHVTYQSHFQRTVVFIRANTDLGENVFIRGAGRGNCSADSCPIPITHRVVPTHAHAGAYYTWSLGDRHLDWNGMETSQHSFHGNKPHGTPMIWTTNKHVQGGPTVRDDGYGYTPTNRLGSNFWMVDIDMDCSQTYKGWFEFKAYTAAGDQGSWEPNVDQTEACGGDVDGRRPYQSINHMALCGKMNIFYFMNYGCTINNINDTLQSVNTDRCGHRNPSRRIVGGHPATPGTWPWMLEVMYQGNHGCGAVLISPTWAVTAGHCVRTAKTYGPWATIVRTGETNRHTISGREKDYFVKQIIKHPLFDKTKPNHDIALLEILTPVYTETDDVTAACLPSRYLLDDFVAKECWAIGWGRTHGGGDRMKLQEVRVDVATNTACHDYYGNNVTTRDVCAGLGSKSACGGDSGSPLSCQVKGRWFVVGVVSWGDDGCHGRPTVFTRISAYLDWIKSETGIDISHNVIIG